MKRRAWATLRQGSLPIVLVLASLGWAQSGAVDTRAWIDDYGFLKHTLEVQYANLAWFGSPEGGVDLPALDQETLKALQTATGDDDARRAVLAFVRSFHDGHFSPLRAPGAPSAAPPPSYSRQDAAAGCAVLGYRPYEASAFSIPFESLGTFKPLADGVETPFRAGTLDAGEKALRIGIVRIPEFESTHVSLCRAAWQDDDVWDADGKFQRGALRRDVEQRWYRALADLLKTFRAQGMAAVLVDIGNNSGGDDSGDIATRLFTSSPVHSSSLWMSQDATVSTPYYDEQLTALGRIRGLDPASTTLVDQTIATFTAGKAQLALSTCSMDWVWHERRSWNAQTCRRLVPAGSSGGPLASLAPAAVANARVAQTLSWPLRVAPFWAAWTGPVYVLMNRRTYSAAEGFAAVLQNNRVATTVGEKTGGDGCGFMNATPPVVLPHSGLRFRLPNCVRIRADGTDEVSGVSPDIAVAPTPDAAGMTAVLTALLTDFARTHPH